MPSIAAINGQFPGPGDARGDQDARRLRQGLDDQHAGHDRHPRPVPVEERLVDAHVLDPDHASSGDQLEHPVDQQERVAMRQGGS